MVSANSIDGILLAPMRPAWKISHNDGILNMVTHGIS